CALVLSWVPAWHFSSDTAGVPYEPGGGNAVVHGKQFHLFVSGLLWHLLLVRASAWSCRAKHTEELILLGTGFFLEVCVDLHLPVEFSLCSTVISCSLVAALLFCNQIMLNCPTLLLQVSLRGCECCMCAFQSSSVRKLALEWQDGLILMTVTPVIQRIGIGNCIIDLVNFVNI
ncbi:hypothetical protein DV515_00012739, partial [Chloebia gouldiae]